ncbi:MAG: hypothetical protein P4L85_24920 [Paludisphaera borealis]|uniref:hypothetical protein n=1 Tax=Paludisphaera borealis TaxID=1387353 RepID=UPI00283EBAAC|nr:hypothetical protein [Paludisphaera borealis]MDR3622618.1 hypothetical protein [Paludisphaera borealis]
MTETRYHELLGRLLDDSLSDPDAEALRDELACNPDRLRDVREHLMLSEFLSQEQAPHRAADAFWEGIRANLDADAPVRTSSRRSFALRAAAVAAALLAAVGIAWRVSGTPWGRTTAPATGYVAFGSGSGKAMLISLRGEVVCEHCVLHESDECRPAVRAHEVGLDGTIHLSDNAVCRDFYRREGCGRTPLPVLAEGIVHSENGRPLLAVTRLEIRH